MGHRAYVGGLWDEMGKLQFDFLVHEGLQRGDVLLDIACGSLRAGRYFIAYLDAGHYLGIDKEPDLVNAGIRHELTADILRAKQPEFVISDSFEFGRFSKRPTFAIAQSLFTHLPAYGIAQCFAKVRASLKDHGRFYATYFQTQTQVQNESQPHDHHAFYYTKAEMEAFGMESSFRSEYIGDWKHPRGQVIVRYVAA